MNTDINREPTIHDFYDYGFKNKDGALYKEGFSGCVQFWDKRFFHADDKGFKSEIKSIDDLNNLIIENTKP